MTEHRIIIQQESVLGSPGFWVLFLIVLGVMFWKWVVAIAITGAIIAASYVMFCRAYDRRKDLLDRADQQRIWYEQGDPRAMFGPDYVEARDEDQVR